MKTPTVRCATVLLLMLSVLVSQPGNLDAQEPEPPRIGLALAGGGALGFAHLGVILELEALGVPVHYVSGTSMGSIIGALYATGYTAEEMLELVSETDWRELFTDRPPRRGRSYRERRAETSYLLDLGFGEEGIVLGSGVSSGQNVVQLLDETMRAYAVSGSFDRFPRPLRIVATDLIDGEEVVFDEGDLKSAIRASMAVPGVFTPLEYRDRLLIDGGWVNVLPVDALNGLGADRIIAVNLSDLTVTEEELDSLPAVLNQSSAILRRPRLEENLAKADVIIEPDVSGYSVASFEQALALVEAGRQAARMVSSQLKRLATIAEPEPSVAAAARPNPAGDSGIRIWRIAYSEERPGIEEQTILARQLLGKTKISEVQRSVYALYDTGRYTYVSYELLREPQGLALMVHLKPREPARTILRGGYTFRSQPFSSVNPRFVMRSNLTVTDVTTPRSELGTTVHLSEISSLRSEFIQPLLRPVSLIAAVYAEGEPIQFYRDRRVESAYDYRRFGGSLGFRSVIFEALQFRLDGVGEWAGASLQEGTDLGLDRGEGQLGFTAAAVADSYDRFPFPRRGTESVINYDYRYQPAAERGFNRLSFEQQYYLPLFDRSALGLGFRFSTDFSSETPFYRRAFLGGFGSFSGLYDQELTGRHSLVGSGELRFNIFSLPLGAGDKVYISLKGDLGTIWDGALVEIRNDPEFILGGSAGFSADTIFGQVHLHFALAGGEGLGDDPLRYTTYLLLGNRVEAPLSAGYR